KLLLESGLKVEVATDLWEAAQKIVAMTVRKRAKAAASAHTTPSADRAMDAAPARARAPIGWALQVACGQSLPRLSRHSGPVALVMRRVSTALRSGSLPEFASPWS